MCRNPELLEAWRPLAKDFDIFFGLEAASDEGLAHVVKDNQISASVDAAAIARSMKYGVTGNFLVDPDWTEEHFRELWDFVAKHGFQRAGYTILTPLPGTELFQKLSPILEGQPWFKYDMHHVLWEPRLGAKVGKHGKHDTDPDIDSERTATVRQLSVRSMMRCDG